MAEFQRLKDKRPCELCNSEIYLTKEYIKRKISVKQELDDYFEYKASLSQLIESIQEMHPKNSLRNEIKKSDDILLLAEINELNNLTQQKIRERDQGYLDLYSRSVEVDKLRREYETILKERIQLERTLDTRNTIKALIKQEAVSLSNQLNSSRWCLALEVFEMMRIEVDESIESLIETMIIQLYERSDKETFNRMEKNRSVHGCSTILGLPLPNDGNYADVPVELLCSALSHICHLVDSLSAVLNIPLPHSIKPFESFDEAYIVPSNLQDTLPDAKMDKLYSVNPVRQAGLEPPGHFKWESEADISSRLKSVHNATADSLPKTKNPEVSRILRSSFSSAVALLRANIVVLCLRCGIPTDFLYCKQAVLINLHILHQYCRHESRGHMDMMYVDLMGTEDITSLQCKMALTDRYFTDRWSASGDSKHRPTARTPPSRVIDERAENFRIISCESDWAVVDINKNSI